MRLYDFHVFLQVSIFFSRFPCFALPSRLTTHSLIPFPITHSTHSFNLSFIPVTQNTSILHCLHLTSFSHFDLKASNFLKIVTILLQIFYLPSETGRGPTRPVRRLVFKDPYLLDRNSMIFTFSFPKLLNFHFFPFPNFNMLIFSPPKFRNFHFCFPKTLKCSLFTFPYSPFFSTFPTYFAGV